MKSVYLDAGHGEGVTGKYDPGAVDGVNKSEGDTIVTRENDIAVDMVSRIAHLLRAKNDAAGNSNQGVNPQHGKILGSTGDRENLFEAVRAANALDSDLFVSIHCNSSVAANAHGFEVFYNTEAGKRVAVLVNDAVKAGVDGIYSRGIKHNETFYVLRKTKMTAVLIELCFISNQADEVKINNRKYRQALAVAISDAIWDALV